MVEGIASWASAGGNSQLPATCTTTRKSETSRNKELESKLSHRIMNRKGAEIVSTEAICKLISVRRLYPCLPCHFEPESGEKVKRGAEAPSNTYLPPGLATATPGWVAIGSSAVSATI
jgi:hypothetical protein